MTQSISHILVLFLRLDGNIILVAFSMIVILGDRTMQSLLLPLYDVLEWYFRVPWCISNESIFVGKGPDLFIMNISSWEAYIGQLLFPNST